MTAIKKFRKGESTYTCHCCKKLTRNVGGDERSLQLCKDCYELSTTQNTVWDGDTEAFKAYAPQAKAIMDRRPELKTMFVDLVAALAKE